MYLLPLIFLTFLYTFYYVVYSDLINLTVLYGKAYISYFDFFQNVLSSLFIFSLSIITILLFYYLVSEIFKKIPVRFNASMRAGHYNSMIFIDFQHNQI